MSFPSVTNNNSANKNKFKIMINTVDIESSPQVTLDDQLNSKNHTSNLCQKASKNLNALAGLSSYMDLGWFIIKPYINSQFGNYPLVWMMHS